eukprot:TRINITY_DN6182_c0_g1_i1.p1 TRINITY_DN6182_c0_g1~~TRINITY_DN6182_c0_g1_i1.p1  ORF type:complete len:2503 (+),score=418.74 TRINITY_DN6182_c0_g1_i1:67-7575(+)
MSWFSFRKKATFFSHCPEDPIPLPHETPPGTPMSSRSARFSFDGDFGTELDTRTLELISKDFLVENGYQIAWEVMSELFPSYNEEDESSIPSCFGDCNIAVLFLVTDKLFNFIVTQLGRDIDQGMSFDKVEDHPCLFFLGMISQCISSKSNKKKLGQISSNQRSGHLLDILSDLMDTVHRLLRVRLLQSDQKLEAQDPKCTVSCVIHKFVVKTIQMVNDIIDLDIYAKTYWRMIKNSLLGNMSDLDSAITSWENREWPSKLRTHKRFLHSVTNFFCGILQLQSKTNFLNSPKDLFILGPFLHICHISFLLGYDQIRSVVIRDKIIPQLVLVCSKLTTQYTTGDGCAISTSDFDIISDVTMSLFHTICDIANRMPETAIDLMMADVKSTFRSIMLWIHRETVLVQLRSMQKSDEKISILPGDLDADEETFSNEALHEHYSKALNFLSAGRTDEENAVAWLVNIFFHHVRSSWKHLLYRNSKHGLKPLSPATDADISNEIEVWSYLFDFLFEVCDMGISQCPIEFYQSHVSLIREYPEIQTSICASLCAIILKAECLNVQQRLNDYGIWVKLLSPPFYFACFDQEEIEDRIVEIHKALLLKDSGMPGSKTNLDFIRPLPLRTFDTTNVTLHRNLRKALECAFLLACYNTVDTELEDDIAWNIFIRVLNKFRSTPFVVSELSKWIRRALCYMPQSPYQLKRQQVAFLAVVDLSVDYVRTQSPMIQDKWVMSTQKTLFRTFASIVYTYDSTRKLVLSEDSVLQCLLDYFYNPVTQDLAKSCVTYVLSVDDPSYRGHKTVALRKLCELLSRTSGLSTEHVLSLNFTVLEMIRQLILQNETEYQNHLREAGIFLHIVNVMNGPHATKLCCEVLRTIRALLNGNQESKDFMRACIGYNHIGKLILQVEPDVIPKVVEILFNIALEEEEVKSAIQTAPMVRNVDILPVLVTIASEVQNSDTKGYILEQLFHISESRQYNRGRMYHSRIMDDLLLMLANMPIHLKAYEHLVNLCCSVGAYAVSVKQVRCFFQLLRNDEHNRRPVWNPKVLQILKHIVEHSGPKLYFDFYGAESCLLVPSVGDLSSISNYTFATFVRIENFSKRFIYRPTLLSLLDSEGHGLEIFFEGSSLCVSASHQKKTHKYHFQHTFNQKTWNFIAITHSSSKIPFASDEVKLYVNDEPPIKGYCKFPTFSQDLRHSCIGSRSRDIVADIPVECGWPYGLCGQLGPVYFFNEVLTVHEVKVISSMGYDYLGSFLPYEASSVPRNLRYAFDGSLSSKLVFQYVCKATNGRAFYDIASEDPSNPMIITRTALPNFVSAKVDPPFPETLSCLGGIQVILPLIVSVSFPLVASPEEIDNLSDVSFLQSTMALFQKLIERPYAQDDIFACNGFAAMGFLLRYINPNLHTIMSISTIYAIYDRLLDNDLKTQFLEHVFLNMKIWVYCTTEVQIELWGFVKQIASSDHEFFNDNVGVQGLIDILRAFYWYEAEENSFGKLPRRHPQTQEVLAERPRKDQIHTIRDCVLTCVTILLTRIRSTVNLQPIIFFMISCKDSQQVFEMLEYAQSLSFIWTPDVLESLIDLGALDQILTLVQHSAEEVRLSALRLIGKLFQQSFAVRLIEEKIPYIQSVLQPFPVTALTYRTLLHLLAPKPGVRPEEYVIDDDSTIKHMCVLPVILDLLPHMEEELQARFCQDFSLLFKLSPENRKAAMQDPTWLYYLCRYFCETSTELGESVAVLHSGTAYKLLRQLLSILIVGSLFYQREGYEFVETLLSYMSYHSTQNNILHLREISQQILLDGLRTLCDQISETKSNLGYFLQFSLNEKHEINLVHYLDIVEMFLYTSYLSEDPYELHANQSCHPISSCIDRNSNSIWQRFVAITCSDNPEARVLRGLGGEWVDFPVAIEVMQLTTVSILQSTSGKVTDDEVKRKMCNAGLRLAVVSLVMLCRHESLLPYIDQATSLVEAVIHRPGGIADMMGETHTAQILSALLGTFGLVHPNIAQQYHDKVYPLVHHLIETLPIVSRYLANPEKGNARIALMLPGMASKKISSKDVLSKLQKNETKWDDVVRIFVHDLKKEGSSSRTPTSFSRIRQMSESRENRHVITTSKLEVHLSSQMQLENTIRSRILDYKQYIREHEEKRYGWWSTEQNERSTQALSVWKTIYRNLTSDRGPWSQRRNDKEYWILDPTEDKNRCRRRLKRNYHPDPHENCSAGKAESQPTPTKEQLPNIIRPRTMSLSVVEPVENLDPHDVVEKEPIVELLPGQEPRKRLLYQTEVTLVTPMDSIEGVLEVSSLDILFVPANMDTTKDLPFIFASDDLDKKDRILRWDIHTLREIQPRRYMLQQTALEFFFVDKSTLFINFPKRNRHKVFGHIKSAKPTNLLDTSLAYGAERLAKSNITERWMRREISNFDYLMMLNTIAGRTYNDLMQYPVFPWILADYTSEKLNLMDPNSYRDLSKPMGALNPKRLEIFLDRYHGFVQMKSFFLFLFVSHSVLCLDGLAKQSKSGNAPVI